MLASGFVGDVIGDAELTSTELPSESVGVADVLHWTAEDAADAGERAGRGRIIGGENSDAIGGWIVMTLALWC